MEPIISKEEFNKLMSISGEIRAVGFKSYADFILKEEGEKGLKKLEDVMVSLGYPIKYREMEALKFYPLGLLIVMLVAIKRLFNYSDEKFQEIGSFYVKVSMLIRLFLRYFFSVEAVIKKLPDMWRKHLTVGDLKSVEYSSTERFIILRLENYKGHPLHCQILRGYLSAALQMIVGNKPVCQETKCVFRGDEYHEFLLKW